MNFRTLPIGIRLGSASEWQGWAEAIHASLPQLDPLLDDFDRSVNPFVWLLGPHNASDFELYGSLALLTPEGQKIMGLEGGDSIEGYEYVWYSPIVRILVLSLNQNELTYPVLMDLPGWSSTKGSDTILLAIPLYRFTDGGDKETVDTFLVQGIGSSAIYEPVHLTVAADDEALKFIVSLFLK